jgi:hypothetical protein
MHPQILGQLASQHATEIRESATARHAGRRSPRHRARYRAGWIIVKMGLRLAGPIPGAENAAAR